MQKEKEDEIKAYEAEKEAARQAALIQEAPKEIYPNAGKVTNPISFYTSKAHSRR